MKKIKKLFKKIILILTIILFNMFGFISCVNAVHVNSADIKSLGDCGSLLKYKGIVVKAYYAQYEHNGASYPAYCLNKTKQGVTDDIAYSVNVQDAITDVKLWRIIINGYPYKTIQELGVANKEEAFTATKQAIYCYIHENRPEDYEPIGEAGQRTLNALHKILQDASNSNETKISNTIEIIRKDSIWKQDSIEKNYLSKTYSIKAGAQINGYKIVLTKNQLANIDGIKVTNEKNEEKQEFKAGENFKVLVPIKMATEKGTFKISVESQINTKPVLYGAAQDSQYQDYALTAATYEDATGYIEEEYLKNETTIIVFKQDKDTKQKMEGVEFELLDENKQVVYTRLKTNKDGKIEITNIIPGIYYLKETKAIDGYQIYDELIKLTAVLNEKTTVTVNNRKNETPKVKITEETLEVENIPKIETKKLPVTGM